MVFDVVELKDVPFVNLVPFFANIHGKVFIFGTHWTETGPRSRWPEPECLSHTCGDVRQLVEVIYGYWAGTDDFVDFILGGFEGTGCLEKIDKEKAEHARSCFVAWEI